jgi:probable phosphoglycerate mutase
MATRLYLVRHGATELSAEDRFAGATDVLLSPEGEHQARCLSERLAQNRIDAVYASPLRRTLRTAELIAEPHGLAVTPVDGLREIDHGHWEGLRRAEVEERFGEEYAAWEADPFTFAPEGGESGLAVLARALPALRILIERHAGLESLRGSRRRRPDRPAVGNTPEWRRAPRKGFTSMLMPFRSGTELAVRTAEPFAEASS